MKGWSTHSPMRAAILGLALMASSALGQQSQKQITKLQIAVSSFDVVGSTLASFKVFGSSFAETLQTAILQSGRFEVYDRASTAKLLGEVNFSQLGLTADGQLKLKARNINFLATGSITRLANEIQITFKLINVETTKVEFQKQRFVKGSDDFPEAANYFVSELAAVYPLRGSIIGSAGQSGQYYIDLGSASNVAVNSTGKVLERITQGGRTILRPGINFKVTEVIDQDTAIILVQSQGRDGYVPKPNDLIQFDITTDRGPISVPAAIKGTLVVKIITPGVKDATVTLNGVPLSQQVSSDDPLSVPVEAIPQNVAVSAPGYLKYEQPNIAIKGGETKIVTVALTRATATVRVGPLPQGARVLVNGREQSAPVFEQAPSTIKLEVVAPGYELFTRDVTLSAGQEFVFNPQLKPLAATLLVFANVNGASVVVNNQARGTTNANGLEIPNLAAGSVTVTVQAPGYEPVTRTVTLEPGGRKQESFALQAKAVTLTVKSAVDGATVSVDGQPRGQIKNGQLEIPVVPGAREIVVSASGYIEYRNTLNLAPGQPSSLSATLRRAQANLNITSQPSGATVKINGRNIGKTPFIGGIEPGSYNVTIELEGFEPVEQKLAATADNTSTFTATLRPSVGTLSLVIQPANATVSVNSRTLTPTERTAGVKLAPGTYTLEVSAEGFETERATITIVAGSNTQKIFSLEKPKTPSPSATPPPPSSPPVDTAPPGAIFVSSDSSGGSGSRSQPLALKAAFERAGKNTTVTLLPGAYSLPDGGLNVPPGAKIVAEGAGVSINGRGGAGLTLAGDATFEGITLSKFEVALRISAGNVELRNTRIESSKRAIEVSGNASLTLVNPTVIGNSQGANIAAIFASGQSRLTITGGMFEGNISAAIKAANNAILVITKATFKNNWGGVNAHILLADQVNATITETTFVGGRYSIRVEGGSVIGSACKSKNIFQGAFIPQLLDPGAKFSSDC